MKNTQQEREVGEKIAKRCLLILPRYHGLSSVNAVSSISFNRNREIGNEVANRMRLLM